MDRNPGAMARPLNPMPEDVLGELVARGLKDAYDAHPQYQRNDYLGWITPRGAGADRDQAATQTSAAMTANTAHAGCRPREASAVTTALAAKVAATA